MITSLELENFKCFSQLRLDVGSLTLLTGYNAGGKSSAIQPLLLLSQAARVQASPNEVALNGHFVKLGSVGDIMPTHNPSQNFIFRVSDDAIEQTWIATGRAGERILKMDYSLAPKSSIEKLAQKAQSLAEKRLLQKIAGLSYLSAVRVGLEDTYPIPESYQELNVDVGIDGRYAPYWYDQFADEEIMEARRFPRESASSFRKQFDAWFSTLFPNGQATATQYPQLSLQGVQYRISEFGAWLRPANVGYGFSYAFPVLVSLLAAKEGQVIVIDSPEAHLHPYAQSQMGRLIAQMVAAGIQVIVETHSDHLLNGIRLAVKEQVLSCENLKIYFFSGANGTDHGVLSLNIDREGRIRNWPKGFFDQSEIDLARLSGWE